MQFYCTEHSVMLSEFCDPSYSCSGSSLLLKGDLLCLSLFRSASCRFLISAEFSSAVWGVAMLFMLLFTSDNHIK